MHLAWSFICRSFFAAVGHEVAALHAQLIALLDSPHVLVVAA